MKRIHIFNCSNDMALASGLSQYQPPKHISQMEKALDFLPAWWAGNGDAVIVDDPDKAREFASSLGTTIPDIHFIGWNEGYRKLKSLSNTQYTPSPWGWSKAIASRLKRWGLPENAIPDTGRLEKMRELSSREYAVGVLKRLAKEVSEHSQMETPPMIACTSIESIRTFIEQSPWPSILKSPWSSSGRGILTVENGWNESVEKWCTGVLSRQKSVIADRLYDKELDFALEFNINENGKVDCLGYSIFNAASSGQYTGNIVAQQDKLASLLHDSGILPETLHSLKSFYINEFSRSLYPMYTGPVGVDMIICKGEKPTIHPCIEINLRMNMGIAAIHLAKRLKLPVCDTFLLTPPGISSTFTASVTNGRLTMFAPQKQ